MATQDAVAKARMNQSNRLTSFAFFVTTHIVRLKLFRLKTEGGQKSTIAVLWRKYLILAPNMASKCAVFSLFPNSLQPSAYPPE